MGLFDKRDSSKKKKDDFDSPVEQIDLSAPVAPPSPEPVAAKPSPLPGVAAAPSPAATPAPEPVRMREPEPEPMLDPDPEPSRYGINDAIELMRALPPDNVELVVQVVKRTLESTNVKVTTIIEDASAKQKRIEDRIAVLKGEIDDFEKEINTRRDEIGSLEADHEETSTVKDRLMLAEKLVPANGKGAGASAAKAKTSDKMSSVSGTTSSKSAPTPSTPPADKSAPSKTTIVAKK